MGFRVTVETRPSGMDALLAAVASAQTPPLYRLIQQDCLVGMAQLPRGSVDVVVTSPPYNLGKAYGTYEDRKKPIDYLDWMAAIGQLINCVLRDNGSLFLNIGGTPSNPWLPWDVAQRFRSTFHLQNVFHWIKAISLEDAGKVEQVEVGVQNDLPPVLSVGHYKPINSKRYVNDLHEYVFHFTKTGKVPLARLAVGVPYADKSNTKRWAGGKDLRCRGNCWYVPYETIQNRAKDRPHPATFPVRLAELCLLVAGGKPGDENFKSLVTLDPFMGLGSTMVAAANLGHSCLGFDVDAEYLRVAAARVLATGRVPEVVG